jgi:hypothetical protein
MEKKKNFIVTHSNGYGGSRISLSGGNIKFDHGGETIGSILSYDFSSPHWAVNRETLKNRFLGKADSSHKRNTLHVFYFFGKNFIGCFKPKSFPGSIV